MTSTADKSTKTPRRGEHITVFNSNKTELGEGTFRERSQMGNVAVYECEEHTILARGEHWIKIDNVMIRIKA